MPVVRPSDCYLAADKFASPKSLSGLGVIKIVAFLY